MEQHVELKEQNQTQQQRNPKPKGSKTYNVRNRNTPTHQQLEAMTNNIFKHLQEEKIWEINDTLRDKFNAKSLHKTMAKQNVSHLLSKYWVKRQITNYLQEHNLSRTYKAHFQPFNQKHHKVQQEYTYITFPRIVDNSISNNDEIGWVKRASFPSRYCSAPLITKNGNIVLFALNKENRQSSKSVICNNTEGALLYMYDNINDKYIELTKLPKMYQNACAQIDTETDIIYIPSSASCGAKMMKIYLETEEIECFEIDSLDGSAFDEYPVSIIVANKLHIFGWYDSHNYIDSPDTRENFHYVYDCNSIKKYFVGSGGGDGLLRHLSLWEMCCMVYRKSINECLLICGNSSIIYPWNLKKTERENEGGKELRILPKELGNGFGCVLTKDEKYIITFGGWTDSIYIINIDEQCVKLSDIKCPRSGSYQAFLANNYNDTEKVMNGFLRGCREDWKFGQFYDLICLLSCFYGCEYVHIITCDRSELCHQDGYIPNKFQGNHWMMLLDTILNSF